MYTIANLPTIILLTSFSCLILANPAPAPTPLTTIRITASDLPSIASRVSSYEAQLTTEAKFSSVMSVLSTGLPASVSSSLVAGGLLADDGFTTESWYTAIPSDVKSYMSSVGMAEVSIMTAKPTVPASSSIAGAAETGVPKVMVGVMGALGAAAMML